MKKSLASIFIGLLVLLFFQPAHGDSRNLRTQNALFYTMQVKNGPVASNLGLFSAKKHIVLPSSEKLIRHEHGKRGPNGFPFLDAFFSAKAQWIEKLNTWGEYLGYGKIESTEAVLYRASKTCDPMKLKSHDCLGLSLNHKVGQSKVWKLSLDLGVDFKYGRDIGSETGSLTEPAPALQTELNRQQQDLSDPLKRTAPFIGLGITCRF